MDRQEIKHLKKKHQQEVKHHLVEQQEIKHLKKKQHLVEQQEII